MTSPGGILALDTARRTGWAFARLRERPVWGTVEIGEPNCSIGLMMSEMRQFIDAKCDELEPLTLCFESPYVPVPRVPRFGKAGTFVAEGKGPPPMNPLTLRKLIGLAGVVEMVAHDRGLACYEATTGQIAKFFTGSARWYGRSNKKAATIAAAKRHGWDVGEDDNSADALALLVYYEAILYPASRRSIGPLFKSLDELPRPGAP